ncbi:Translation elongation factor Ts [hydrothermal vent metagenome]|uniref:Translation elongation factor Ts n=1 Tax=hydrothermal vent metagenome TaxID=652676 RepID=A0A3B1BNT5_9ZZZZ
MVKDLRRLSGAGIMECKEALKESEGNVDTALEFLRKKGAAKAAKKADRSTKEGAINIQTSGGSAALVEIKCETDFVSRNDKFQGLCARLATLALNEGPQADEDAFMNLSSGNGSKTISDLITESIHELGENILVGRRVWMKLDGDGGLGSYVHGAGSIGVLVDVGCDSADATQKEEFKALLKDISMHIAAANPVAIDENDVSPEALAKEKEIFEAQAKESGKPDNIIPKIVEGKIKKYYKEICLLKQAYVKDPDKSVKEYLDETAKNIGASVSIRKFNRVQLGE